MGPVPVSFGYPEVMKMSASTARKKSSVRGWSESKLFTLNFSSPLAEAGAGMPGILPENDLTRGRTESFGEAFVSDQSVMLWSSVAQVRQALATLHYGEKVEVLSRRNDNYRVRTAAGTVGWVDGRLLMEPSLWQRSAQLLAKTRSMPVQARGRTKVSTNLRFEPGRTQPRL